MQILQFLIGFFAIAVFPLILAGYGGHLATLALDGVARKKALLIIWSLAGCGILAAGLNQYFFYKSEKELQGRLNSIDQTGQKILKGFINSQWGLNANQLDLLSRVMSKFIMPEEKEDFITCVMGDPDSTKFAINLVKAFRDAGWQLSGNGFGRANFNKTVTGVIIKFHSEESNPPGLNEFVAILRQANIEPIGELDNKIPNDRFRIIIGRKP